MMTSRRIHIKGTRYRTGGRIGNILHIREQLRTWGASEISNSTTPDFWLLGPSCGTKESKALAAGIPILYIKQLPQALEDGYFDYESSFIQEDLDINEVIAELRGAFAEPPTSRTWTTCLELIERCPDTQIEPVLHYINQGIARWRDEERAIAWQPDPSHDLLKGVHKLWVEGCPPDELCVAPPIWLYELTAKKVVRHDKFKLVRALNCESMRLNQYGFKRLLNHPDLENVRVLNLGARNNCSGAFLEKLSEHAVVQQVEELWLLKNWGFHVFLAPNKILLKNLKCVRFEYFIANDRAFCEKIRKLEMFPDEVEIKPLPYQDY